MNGLPKYPPPELLNSMMLRYDHALGCPGYYDQPIYSDSGLTHEQRKDSALRLMKQLYDEVAGNGFFRWKKQSFFEKLFSLFKKSQSSPKKHIWKEFKRENLGIGYDDIYPYDSYYRIAVHEKCLLTGETRIVELPCRDQ